jgi:hypothetical protein
MKWAIYSAVALLLFLPRQLHAQEYAVLAVDSKSGKPLSGVPIVLRYACTFTGSGEKIKEHCKSIHRTTGKDGIAHFPEAGSLADIDDIFPMSVAYQEVCCDISRPEIPGVGKITFRSRSFRERLAWILLGD